MEIKFEKMTTLHFDIMASLSIDKFTSIKRVVCIIESNYRRNALILTVMFVLQSFSARQNGELVVRNDRGSYRLTKNGELVLKAWKAGFIESEKRQLTQASTSGIQPAVKSK